MDEEDEEGPNAEQAKEEEQQGYENSWEQLSKRMRRILRYGRTKTDEEGWAKMTTLNKRGWNLTTGKIKKLCKGKGGGGGRRTRFEMSEQTGETLIRLVEEVERNKKRYTPMD